MGPAETGAALRVEVMFCPAPGQVDACELTLDAGSTLMQAVQGSGVLQRHGLAAEGLRCGIWGKLKPADAPLRDGERVEIYRPLQVDPKEARRQRYQRSGKARSR